MRACLCVVVAAAGSALLLAASAEAGSIKREGLASWYKMGTKTANGERYDPMGITAAHPSLPFDTKVRVTNPNNGKSIVVRINDRGPFTGGRIIDLSQGAAKAIAMTKAGVAKVKIEVVGGPAKSDVAAAPAAAPVAEAAEAQPGADTPPVRLATEQRIAQASR